VRLKGILFLLGGLILGVGLGALVLLSSGSFTTGRPAQQPPTIGEPARDFELQRLDGGTQKLSDLKGKAVLLNFWATWCPPCKEEMPLLEQLGKKYSEKLVILGINDQEGDDLVKEYTRSNQIHFPILMDRTGNISDLYLVRNYPTSFFIDADGVLRAQHLGILQEKFLDPYLKAIGIEP
jgi:thiol-disulfide isomerase/thioredoxin